MLKKQSSMEPSNNNQNYVPQERYDEASLKETNRICEELGVPSTRESYELIRGIRTHFWNLTRLYSD